MSALIAATALSLACAAPWHATSRLDASLACALDDAGFTATLASNSEFEIVRYLRPGDTVSAETVVESISEEKQTRIGTGGDERLDGGMDIA